MLLDVLYRIHADPEEYLGCRSLERLNAFLLGYGTPAGSRNFLIDDAFRDWIIRIHNPSFGVTAMDVFWILGRIVSSDDRGFELFFKHLESTLAAHPGTLLNPSVIEERSVPPPHLSCYLDALSARPAMHLPKVNPSSLRAFLDGRRLALLEEGYFECADLDGFEHWVRRKLELRGLFRWENAILAHFRGNEKEAFQWSIQELKAYRHSLGAPSDRQFEIKPSGN